MGKFIGVSRVSQLDDSHHLSLPVFYNLLKEVLRQALEKGTRSGLPFRDHLAFTGPPGPDFFGEPGYDFGIF